MTVITLTMDFGTLGWNLPTRLAGALGLRLVDQRPLEAAVAECSEAGDDVVGRFTQWGCSASRWQMTPNQLAFRLTEEALQEAAVGNVLIVGCIAPGILGSIGQGLRVRMTAPPAHRERQVMRQLAYNHAGTARLEIESRDAATRRAMRRLFDVSLDDPGLFDIVLNVENFADEQCMAILKSLACAARDADVTRRRAVIRTQLRALREIEAGTLPLAAIPMSRMKRDVMQAQSSRKVDRGATA